MNGSTNKSGFKQEVIPQLDALYNFAVHMTFDPDEAEDLVQGALVKARRFYSSYEKDGNAGVWLFRILKNCYLNEYQERGQQSGRVDYDAGSTLAGVVHEDGATIYKPRTLADAELEQDDISRGLKDIPEHIRMVLILCDLENFSYEEIGNILDISLNTVKYRLQKGRNQLMKQLAQYTGEQEQSLEVFS